MESQFINRNIDDMFSKKFCLNDGFNYEMKSENLYKADPWQINELQQLKLHLNEVKGKLNHYNLLKWHNHTRQTNRAGDIIKCLRSIKPELLTQAWCKFYEILSLFNLFPKCALDNEVLNTIHLCEAPGAFITSLNHFLKLNYKDLKWRWMASTLNPYFEGNDLIYMINDDRFIVHTLENWCFGLDFTGNIKNKENLINLVQKAELLKPIHLVTADGSVDCHTNPAEQESYVSSLQYCETVAALSILEKGGTFVLKNFTIFECATVCLLYILCCSFRCVQVIKPVCSKEGNSEVYTVCLDFKGKHNISPLLTSLIDNYENLTEPKVIFSLEDIPKSFLTKIIECATFFKYRQELAIERNIRWFEGELSRKQCVILRRSRSWVSRRFIAKYNITPITSDQRIVANYSLYNVSLKYCPKEEDFSFADKVLTEGVTLEGLLRNLQGKLQLIDTIWTLGDIHWLKLDESEDYNKIISIQTGRLIENICSSVFCSRTLVETRNILEHEIISKGNFQTSTLDEFNDFNWLYLDGCDFKGNHILDFRSSKPVWMKTGNNCEFQLKVVRSFINTLKEMKPDDSLVVKNFPLLTQFNVGLVFILEKMFSAIGFVNPTCYGYTLIFYKLKHLNGCSFLEQLEERMLTLQNTTNSIVALVSIKHLYCKEFYKCVTLCNHLVLKMSTLNVINSILKE